MSILKNLRSTSRETGIVRYALVFLVLISIPVCASAASRDQSDNVYNVNPDSPWRISAREINYDKKTDLYIAKGNASIAKDGKTLTADTIRFDRKGMKAFASGHVVLKTEEDILSGASMEFDLASETGTIHNGILFSKPNHFYIKGNRIQKVGESAFTADRVTLSTCDGDNPMWKITGKNLKVVVEGYGRVSHATLWIRKIPVLYTPILIFPMKSERQTGLLPPRTGFSNRKGVEYIQPFYWAINESSDVTLYNHYMDRRGNKIGFEYRYILDARSKGTLMYDFLNDRKVDDGTLDSTGEWGYEDDNIPRPNSDRYWFRMKHDQPIPFGLFAKIDFDVVSDQDYLLEFKDGYTGFDDTAEYFSKDFGRILNRYDDPVRVNRLNINRNWSRYILNAEMRWYDNVVNRRQKVVDTTLQKLPFIEFDALKQPFLDSRFFFDFDSEYIHFFRKNGTRGHRADTHIRLYRPYRFKDYFSVEPSMGLRQTIWNVDEFENTSEDGNRILLRRIYDLRMDVSTEIFRVFHQGGERLDRLKHIIRPRVVYSYIPEKFQDKYPVFDYLDRIAGTNLLTYSITNIFLSRSIKQNKEKKDEKKTAPDYIYRRFSRLELEQSYDIDKAKKSHPEPFSPIYGRFDLVPTQYLSISADGQWSTYRNQFLSRNLAVAVSDNRADRLFLEYRNTKDISESIYADFLLKISSELSASADYERNLHDGKRIRTSLGLLYQAQCWSLVFQYRDEENDQKFELMIHLFGLGGFGI